MFRLFAMIFVIVCIARADANELYILSTGGGEEEVDMSVPDYVFIVRNYSIIFSRPLENHELCKFHRDLLYQTPVAPGYKRTMVTTAPDPQRPNIMYIRMYEHIKTSK